MARLLPWMAAVGIGLAGVGVVMAADGGDAGSTPDGAEVGLDTPPAPPTAATPPTDGAAAPATASPPVRPPVPPPVGSVVGGDEAGPTAPAAGPPARARPAPPRPNAEPTRVVPQEFVGPPIEGAGPVKAGTGWEESLAAREVALVRAQIALNQEMAQVRQLQAQVEDRWAEAERAKRFAEQACGASVVAGLDDVGVVPPSIEEANERVDYVASLVKKMKPDEAAALLQQWDDALAVRVLEIVSARAAAPIISKMPPAVGGRLTRRMATGKPSLPPGGLR